MPRVRWSETLEHQDDVSSLNNNRVQSGSSLKPPSMGNARKPKAAIRKERQRREEAKDDGAEAWRERGKLYRASLIMKDEEAGGDAFTLSNECEIEKYYDVGERVLEQFLNTTVENKEKLTEAYLVGNRLVKFVSRVLPTHRDYFSSDPKLEVMRTQSQAQLVQLLQYLEELALIIDEEEYQDFIRENQESNALSDKEEPSFAEDESDEVSSLEGEGEPLGESFGERPSFADSDAAQREFNENQNLKDFEVHTKSRIRALQDQESNSWDEAFSNQIVPQLELPDLEPKQCQIQAKAVDEDLFTSNNVAFQVEWDVPADFDFAPRNKGRKPTTQRINNTSFFPSPSFSASFSDTWPSEPGIPVSSNVWINQEQQQRPDSPFTASPAILLNQKTTKKMTLRPKALYGSIDSSDREYSPKSVMELPQFLPEKKVEEDHSTSFTLKFSSGSIGGYRQRVDVEQPPPSDDVLSALSDEEEEASLTGAPMRRRKRMGHFKGCVRYLLE
eukprot:CAMPEP_0202491878 /NCGR_PEP_ID=MMETSP1361-20130828/8797_1 /ASSEMBLY_ACC=CAM_ASM_000849 /TAXON_ID=210615 /ORGANISM="Staurosira complex sp., Strain CCMP2646" /LENGTH=501 /DNA_ID=CAMNT_0049121997 /DNA_START=123 /DNA_END=1628 /DNA_ORIENTATION=-